MRCLSMCSVCRSVQVACSEFDHGFSYPFESIGRCTDSFFPFFLYSVASSVTFIPSSNEIVQVSDAVVQSIRGLMYTKNTIVTSTTYHA
jgi:hypothetical protein